MAPEYGATVGFFPVDDETLRTCGAPGAIPSWSSWWSATCKEQGLFRTEDTPEPEYTEVLELDMGTVEPSLAGPRRPQDRLALGRGARVLLQGAGGPRAGPTATAGRAPAAKAASR